MSKDWGKIMIARRYEPFSPSDAAECYTSLAQWGLREGDVREAEFNKTMHWASNRLARKLLKSDCDSICFIDSDAIFGSQALEELRSDPQGWDYDVLQAFTVKRGYPPEPMYFVEFAQELRSPEAQARGTHFTTQLPLDPDFIYEAGAVSLHFTLIRRWIFEKLLDPLGPERTYWFEYKQDQGEDMTFSVNARRAGARMGMTTRLKVAHGSYVQMGWASMIEYYDAKFRAQSGEPPPSVEGLHKYFSAEFALAQLLGEYTGETPDEIMIKATSAAHVIRDEWNIADPKTPAEFERFYATQAHYLYDLVHWNASPMYQRILRMLAEVKGERVLEFGGGLGTLTEYLATRGNRVDYCDVPGVLLDFARWRFRRLNGYADNIRVVSEWELGAFDRVVAIDVLEHLHPDSAEVVIEGLILTLKPGGYLVAHNEWDKHDGRYPQHFDHSAIWSALIEKYRMVEVSEMVWQKPQEEKPQ